MSEKDTYFKHRSVDTSTYSNYTIPRYLIPYLPGNTQARILDIGCGLGQFLHAMKHRGYEHLTGIDISNEAVDACKKQGIDAKVVNDIREFKTSQKFDFIIMSHVLEHIEKNLVIDTLNYIRTNLLSEKGQFALMVPNGQSFTGTYWRYEDFTHHTVFTAGSCDYVLKAAGFTRIEFIDADGTSTMAFWKKPIIKFLLYCYKKREDFWGFVLQTGYHKPSPRIYSFEIKLIAMN